VIKHIMTVGIDGFVGAIARFGISGLVHHYYRGDFPTGTLFVNTLGNFVIGIFIYLLIDEGLIILEDVYVIAYRSNEKSAQTLKST